MITTQLITEWGERLDPNHVLEEYPRPQLMRDSWLSLNGFWDYAFTDTPDYPDFFEGTILVPFSPESLLSRVHRQLMPDGYLWYERTLPIHSILSGKRCILHFGAADQCALVLLNGRKACRHVGGYLPFETDITKYLEEGENTLTVRIQDFTDQSYHSRGKQSLRPDGMFYTAQSGLWQTVWLEWVPDTYIRDFRITPDIDAETVRFDLAFSGAPDKAAACPVQYRIYQDGQCVVSGSSLRPSFTVSLPDPHLWTPEDPHLYLVKLTAGEDTVTGYFAMRSYTIERDGGNIPRFCLNHSSLFLNGVLDQGYWPDGLYTAPSDEALIYDIRKMKELGFNLLRKHGKIEPARWYYHCDRLGMIVWQDMVNGGGYFKGPHTWIPNVLLPFQKGISDTSGNYWFFGRRNQKGREEFVREAAHTMALLSHFPSVATYVLFNEGWGQFEASRLTSVLKRRFPGSLIDSASGWFDQGCGDYDSLHIYFHKLSLRGGGKRRCCVLSEYGGFACRIPGHMAVTKGFGYRDTQSPAKFRQAFHSALEKEMPSLVAQGLSAAIFTQLSDVEGELNGILTYDRKICKLDP